MFAYNPRLAMCVPQTGCNQEFDAPLHGHAFRHVARCNRLREGQRQWHRPYLVTQRLASSCQISFQAVVAFEMLNPYSMPVRSSSTRGSSTIDRPFAKASRTLPHISARLFAYDRSVGPDADSHFTRIAAKRPQLIDNTATDSAAINKQRIAFATADLELFDDLDERDRQPGQYRDRGTFVLPRIVRLGQLADRSLFDRRQIAQHQRQ